MLEIENQVTYSQDVSDDAFGVIDDGPSVGFLVLFNGGLIRDSSTGELKEMEPTPGIIIGQNGKQVLINIETGFLGWIGKKQYRILNTIAGPHYTTRQ